jgi:hypothetical protein
MAIATTIKLSINRCIRGLNLQIQTLTVEKLEKERLAKLEKLDYFAQPVFPLPMTFESMTFWPLLEDLHKYRARFDAFKNPGQNRVGYTFENEYFSSPDAEVTYAMIRRLKPTKIVEVGGGYSTKIIQQAAQDGNLKTFLISIDPNPRTEIERLVDKIYRQPVETLKNTELFESLNEGDVLFIDSSHTIKSGNDVVFLYSKVIPLLRPGVVIHIHDIFLPYEYPREWVVEKGWEFNEQYLVQCLLTFGNSFEVMWAGYYIQRTRPHFAQHFPHLNGRTAKSLWIRKIR